MVAQCGGCKRSLSSNVLMTRTRCRTNRGLRTTNILSVPRSLMFNAISSAKATTLSSKSNILADIGLRMLVEAICGPDIDDAACYKAIDNLIHDLKIEQQPA